MRPTMYPSNTFKFIIPVILLVIFFISCDMDKNPVGTLEEAVERIPDVLPIQGAENATVIVRDDRDRSYFKITIENTLGRNGVYNAWCAQLAVSLQRGVEHPGTQLYDTDRDNIFNRLSYIVNRRNVYEREMQGLSWKEIQVVFWVLLETGGYNLAAIENRIPGSVEGYNATFVNTILQDVQMNGSSFQPGATDIRLFYYEIQDNQNGIGEQTAWAWAGDQRAIPFSVDGQPWGWYFAYEKVETNHNGVFRTHLWAGAGLNDLSKGTEVGTADFWVDNSTLNVLVQMYPEYCFTNLQLYVGENVPNQIPGSFPYKRQSTVPDDEYSFQVDISGFKDNLYIALHADVIDCP
jgi:hypothetical protein